MKSSRKSWGWTMIKPRITWDMEHMRYYCMDIEASFGWPVVGWGDTPKEAFTDWYIKQIGTDIVSKEV